MSLVVSFGSGGITMHVKSVIRNSLMKNERFSSLLDSVKNLVTFFYYYEWIRMLST